MGQAILLLLVSLGHLVLLSPQLGRLDPASLLVPCPLSLPSLLGSPGVHFLPLFLEAHPFLEVLGDRGAPRLLACLEVPFPHRVLEGLAAQSPPSGPDSLELQVDQFAQEDQEAPSRPEFGSPGEHR